MEDYANFVEQHQIQLIYSGVPNYLWSSLFSKLKNEIFDAGNYFTMIEGDEELNETDYRGRSIKVACIQDILISNPESIFLIDHAWTYQLSEARHILTESTQLLNRMCSLMEIEEDNKDINERVECVLKKMWLYNQTYSIEKLNMDVAQKVPLWYIMDEFGSSLGHSSEPNFRLVPFYFTSQQISFSLLFPIKNVQSGEEVTRNYIEGYASQTPEWNQFYLLPWFPKNFTNLPFNNVIENDSFYRRRVDIELPEQQQQDNKIVRLQAPFKVYMDTEKLRINLTDSLFKIVDSSEEADILWLDTHVEDFKSLFETRPNVYVNQFPYEEILTAKDLLAAVVHLAYANFNQQQDSKNTTLITYPPWLAPTFNSSTELPQFVSYFQNREKLTLDNTWIIKPWNLARGIDTCVTNDLNQIIRMIDTKNKIICKYIDRPVLFHRDDLNAFVKFDMRFIVMLKSIEPLQLYVYNRFWLRFALKAFSLDSFDDYEKHFTVFNYTNSGKIKQMYCNDFIDQFSHQYPDQNWSQAQEDIYKVIKETFQIATKNSPPKGLLNRPNCRAMYGIDMMLSWTDETKTAIQPVLLEVNFMPDCTRACNYYSDFVNTIFRTLFSDENQDLSSLPITRL